MSSPQMLSLRLRIAQELDPALREQPGLSRTNQWVIVIICLSLIVAIIATEPTLYVGNETGFFWVEILFLGFFIIEYLLRVWSSIENPKNTSRWRYMLRPMPLLDLVTILVILATTMGSGGFLLRLARILRIVRIARLGQFSSAVDLLANAVKQRRFELMISGVAALLLLLISSSFLYLVEGGAQPEHFGSIPRAMWWSVATLTTVGYGDVYPITALGKLFAGITAVAGIGLIAMPTGILAGAVSDAIQQARRRSED